MVKWWWLKQVSRGGGGLSWRREVVEEACAGDEMLWRLELMV